MISNTLNEIFLIFTNVRRIQFKLMYFHVCFPMLYMYFCCFMFMGIALLSALKRIDNSVTKFL